MFLLVMAVSPALAEVQTLTPDPGFEAMPMMRSSDVLKQNLRGTTSPASGVLRMLNILAEQ